MPTLMTDRCLMIEMRDHRRMFTNQENLMKLMEFSRTFNAKISLVEARNVELFSLDELPAVICDGNYQHQGEYFPLETVLQKGQRQNTITLADSIRGFIRQSLLTHQTISLRILKDKYQDQGLSESCLCGHLSLIRRTMQKEGFQIDRLAKGTYRLNKP